MLLIFIFIFNWELSQVCIEVEYHDQKHVNWEASINHQIPGVLVEVLNKHHDWGNLEDGGVHAAHFDEEL